LWKDALSERRDAPDLAVSIDDKFLDRVSWSSPVMPQRLRCP
jgi:hypothetical protein